MKRPKKAMPQADHGGSFDFSSYRTDRQTGMLVLYLIMAHTHFPEGARAQLIEEEQEEEESQHGGVRFMCMLCEEGGGGEGGWQVDDG